MSHVNEELGVVEPILQADPVIARETVTGLRVRKAGSDALEVWASVNDGDMAKATTVLGKMFE